MRSGHTPTDLGSLYLPQGQRLCLYLPLRYEIKGAHTDKVYSYKVGICVDATDEAAGCAVVQTDSQNYTDKSYCVGKTAMAQVARSRSLSSLSLSFSPILFHTSLSPPPSLSC